MSLENPFQDPLRFERRVPECAMVIFGANGDLTKRKLLPALYRLAYERRLDAGFAVLGISRTPLSDDQFREKMLASVKEFLEDSPFDADVWTAFAQGLFYMAGDIDNPAVFPALDARLKEIEAARHTCWAPPPRGLFFGGGRHHHAGFFPRAGPPPKGKRGPPPHRRQRPVL